MTSLSASEVHASAFSSRRQQTRMVEQASFKSDVLLVLFWAGLIPGLMWLGSLMGY
jgi:hypothetical protein